MDKKGQTIIDIFLVLFVIILSFLVFYSLTEYKKDQFEKTIKFLAVTENAVSKYNPFGIGFTDKNDIDEKTVFKNTIKEIKLIEPIKRIEVIDLNGSSWSEGNANCDSKIVIPRLIIYENEIRKINFTFCS
ncbi:MAG: hypothetical protein COT14_03685 [Candidatus Diapherotrites archaeon CG08_land_8_20_14_0_20_30_16]|nr:MAG: hypothetical protein COT14_03685 [Candidatus Diapherotrites archaeon CG08_land_8_20_14_0_20_30_16]